MIDSIITDIDSPVYHTAEYDNHGGLFLYRRDGYHVFVADIDDSDFAELRANPNHETCEALMGSHRCNLMCDC